MREKFLQLPAPAAFALGFFAGTTVFELLVIAISRIVNTISP